MKMRSLILTCLVSLASMGVMATSAQDSQITEKESQSIRARWEALKSVTEEFVRCCEEGNFREIKHPGPARKIKTE